MLEIITVGVTPFQQNCRILHCSESGEAVVVDPGGDAETILFELSSRSIKATDIWLTHSHLDHCGAVAELKLKLGGKLIAHKEEQMLRANVENIAGMYGLARGLMRNCPEPDIYIAGGEDLALGRHKFKVLYTPGHSPGHLCFYNVENSCLIAGDTLFQGSIGRTDLPGGDHETLIRSIKDVILSLPDETVVMPGHGPDTTVGAERNDNPFL